ncbi:MAG: (2Fe-2S) ferredoxin domain-containing protein [Firmicutes bacterium]|nr:(2Fe-2S) ferredoxin domain-containing protein [[Eubacterium] siraeum]MCM1488056.1 (2Fe-2S) ferredoxin domain-containing protein [Bacillota bacterium]
MIKINVCVGSSCHIRGSYRIIELLNNAIKENNLTDKVEVSAAFCLGHCMNGVSVKVNDQIFGVNEDSFGEFFEENVKQPALADA